MGPLIHFEKIVDLYQHMESYYKIPYIKRRIQQHKNQPDKPSFNEFLRFSCQSEVLMWIHVEKNLQVDEYFMKRCIHGLNRRY